jgi:transcriptional regulator with XRE-family HTH domain
MVDYADIGKRIRTCRLAKGMTQEQLANEVGVVVTHISHIETGNSVPSLKTLIDIINALDCSADELLCIEIKKAKPVFDSWMTEQLADCSSDEAKIIKEISAESDEYFEYLSWFFSIVKYLSRW